MDDAEYLFRIGLRLMAGVLALGVSANFFLPWAADNVTPTTWAVFGLSFVAFIGLVIRASFGGARFQSQYASLLAVAVWTLNFFELAPISQVAIVSRLRFLIIYLCMGVAATLYYMLDRAWRVSRGS